MAYYNFYIMMDGEQFGPYSAKQLKSLNVPDDVLITEASMNGEWLPAGKFDIDDMVYKEWLQGDIVDRPMGGSEIKQGVNLPPLHQHSEDVSGWSWGAFIFSWLWGVCNGVYWSLIAMIPGVNIIFNIILGITGRKAAWDAQKGTTTYNDFQEKQRKWDIAAIWAIGIAIAFLIFTIVVLYAILS